MYFKLIHINNNNATVVDEWNLSLPATIGRGEDCDIRINEPSISRQHCRISTNAFDAISVLDLGSTNGIYVRDAKVKQATVAIGENFQVGGLDFKIEMVAQPIEEKHRPQVDEDVFGTQKVEIYEIP